jgi:hypothetical protein
VTLPDIQIVHYQPRYHAEVCELQKGLWSPSAKINAAYLEWKHLCNPYLREPLVYLAVFGGRVVGMRGYFGTKWQFGAPRQTLVVPCAGDTIVAPELRNRGLLARIIGTSHQDMAAKGYRYVFSLSAGPATLFGQLMQGWRSIGSLQSLRLARPEKRPAPRLHDVLRRSPWLVSVYRRIRGRDQEWLAAAAEAPIPRLDGFDARVERRRRIDAHVVVERAPRPAAMADLIGRIGDDERLRHVRDEQYFAWRFQNPRGGYRFLFWEDAGLEGYLVVHACYYAGDSRLRIVDWEGASPRVCEGLMQALVQLADPDQFLIWSATLGDDKRHFLEEAGFRRVEESATREMAAVLVRPTCDHPTEADWLLGNQQLLDLKNWDLRMIYSDGF